jgi:hypothetical protein
MAKAMITDPLWNCTFAVCPIGFVFSTTERSYLVNYPQSHGPLPIY